MRQRLAADPALALLGRNRVPELISIEPHEFIPVGDHVVVPTRQRFRSKAGVDVEQDITQVLPFRGGKVIYATGYRDRAETLEAAGLRE